MMCLTRSCKQWQKSEHAGIGGAAKRERGQRVSAPPETAYDMSRVTLHSNEGCIDGRTSDRVVDHVEALTTSMKRYIPFRRESAIVNRGRAEPFRDGLFVRRDRSEDLRAEALASCMTMCPTPPAPA